MKLKHVALVCASERNADKFYRDLLGLEKAEPRPVPSNISESIFGIGGELTIVNYTGEGLHFEIFVYGGERQFIGRIEHTCIEVEDIDAFLEKCRAMDVEIRQVQRDSGPLTFVADYDGNLFEVKGD